MSVPDIKNLGLHPEDSEVISHVRIIRWFWDRPKLLNAKQKVEEEENVAHDS